MSMSGKRVLSYNLCTLRYACVIKCTEMLNTTPDDDDDAGEKEYR